LRALLASGALMLALASTAQADIWGWSEYLPWTTVGALSNQYGPQRVVGVAAAGAATSGYGCANIQSSLGWVWPSMVCQPHGTLALTPFWGTTGGVGKPIAWNNCNCTQQLYGEAYYNFGI
jgi:hypothetical protein